MSAKEFIKNLVDSGVPQTEIARKVGITPGAITNYLYGKTEPGLETIKKIAAAYGLPLSHFLEDNGAFPGQFEVPDFIRTAPVISLAQAGDNGYWVGPYPETIGMERVPYPSSIKDPNAFAIRVVGNSMTPRYYAGEIVVVDTTKQICNGDDVVVKLTDGRAMIKVWRRLNGTILLESINREYEPIAVTQEEIRHCYKVACRL